ncbi:hypothetical protein HBH89_246290 [Parastagonospora nodorum]|nr:hypothetical protein HBH89_246290 [Parastagonospora nodorum]
MQLLQEALGASQDVQIEDIRLTKSQVVASLRADTKHDWQSARMVVFIRDIKKRLKRSKGKVLVFDESQMVLEVVSNALHANWINHLFIHGSISQADRLAYRDTFKDPESTPRVLLMTSKCGGTGLNGLTVANKCYFITRMLSPAERAQCKARIVRNGNDFNCEVIDFFTNDSIERRTDIITDEKDGKAVRMLDPNKVSAKKRDELCTWDTFERFQKKITFLAVGKKKIAARRGSERASADGNESVSDIPYFSDTTEDDETNPDEERRDAYYGSEDGTSETTYSDAPRSDAPSSDARSSDSDGESPESDTIDDVKEETDLGSHSNPRFSGDGRGTRFTGDPRYRRLRPEDDNEETVYDGDYERGIPRKGNAVPRKGKAVPRKGNAVPRNLQRHPRSYRRRTDLDDRSEDDGPPSAPPTFHRHQHSQYSSDHDRLHWARSQLQIGRHPQIQQPHLNTQYQMGMYQETQQPRTSTNVAGWDGQYHGQSQMTQDPQASYGNTSFRPQAPYPGFPYSPSPNSVTGDGQSTSMRPVYHVPDNAADTGASWIQRPIDQSGDTPAQYGSSTLGYQPTGDPGTIHYNTPFALGNGSFSYNQNPNNHVSPQYTNMAEFGVPTNNTSSSFGFNQMGNNYTYRPNPDVLDPNFDGFTDPRVGPYGNNQTSNNHHNHSNPNANNAGGSRERDSEPDL